VLCDDGVKNRLLGPMAAVGGRCGGKRE